MRGSIHGIHSSHQRVTPDQDGDSSCAAPQRTRICFILERILVTWSSRNVSRPSVEWLRSASCAVRTRTLPTCACAMLTQGFQRVAVAETRHHTKGISTHLAYAARAQIGSRGGAAFRMQLPGGCARRCPTTSDNSCISAQMKAARAQNAWARTSLVRPSSAATMAPMAAADWPLPLPLATPPFSELLPRHPNVWERQHLEGAGHATYTHMPRPSAPGRHCAHVHGGMPARRLPLALWWCGERATRRQERCRRIQG